MGTYTKTISAIFLASTLAAIGCGPSDNNNNTGGGGGEGGEGGGGSGSLTLDQLAAKLLDTLCAGSVECRRAESLAECKASTQFDIDEMKAYVENGTVIYHPEKVDVCLAAFAGFGVCTYSEASQSGSDSAQQSCIDVFEGTVADGGDCFDDEQCKSNTCETDPACMMQCCPGKCTATVAPPPPAKIGESCAGMDVECEAGAYCQMDSMFNPTTCAAKVDMGASCNAFDACKSPSYCDLDFQTGMGTCNVPAATGATCNPDSFYPCDRFDDVCDPMTLKCVTKGVVGADCADNSDCVEYAYCDAATMKCAKDIAEGGACVADMNDCIGDLDCLAGKCGFEPNVVCK